MGIGRRGPRPPRNLEILSKKVCFLRFDWEKRIFITFGSPLEKFWKNPLVAPYGKNPSDAHASNANRCATLKVKNKVRESKQPQDCNEKNAQA